LIKAGALNLTKVGAAGTGEIDFDTGKQTLKIAKGALSNKEFTTDIDNFGFGDVIDLTGLKFVKGAKAIYDDLTDTLTVKSGKVTNKLTLIDPEGTSFKAVDDKHGGTKVVLKATSSTAVASNSDAHDSPSFHLDSLDFGFHI